MIERPPTARWWGDRVLRRCDMTPFDGFSASTWYADDHFTRHTRHAQEHYGTAPAAGGCP